MVNNAMGALFNTVFWIAVAFVTIIATVGFGVARWYYHDSITIGNQTQSSIKLCESQIRRDEHCKLIIKAVPVD